MSELRERCAELSEYILSLGNRWGVGDKVNNAVIDDLEAFAREQRIKGMEAVKNIVQAHVCGALCNCQFFINDQIDAAIKQLKEGG